jgi:hypothetical protein
VICRCAPKGTICAVTRGVLYIEPARQWGPSAAASFPGLGTSGLRLMYFGVDLICRVVRSLDINTLALAGPWCQSNLAECDRLVSRKKRTYHQAVGYD